MLEKGLYLHYKGKIYEVIDIATHSETLERLVVYRCCYGDEANQQKLWVRPFDMFTENIELNGEIVPRFKKC